jgi:type IV secretory pathway VirB2 component (pilin)
MAEKKGLQLDEVQEMTEAVHRNKDLAAVSMTMAVLAVAIAAFSLLGHRSHNEVLLSHLRANYEKAGLAGIKIRQHADGILIEMLDVLHPQDTVKATELRERFERERHGYLNDEARINEEEERIAIEAKLTLAKAHRFDFAELFAELALVLCSVTLLTGRKSFWYGGVVTGGIGVIIAASTLLIR